MDINEVDAATLRMAIEMNAADDAFFTQYQGDETGKHDRTKPRLCLLMNDVWQWASADGETVEWEDVPSIYALWKEQGSDGLLVWACKKRNMRPQKPLFDKLKPEVQAQVKDLPPAGDVVIPVGDGKVAVFDDGWGKTE